MPRVKVRHSYWHEWRNQGIGSSDAAVVFGFSPYMTPEQLLADKAGVSLKRPMTAVMGRGVAFEQVARTKYEQATGRTYSACCYVHNDYDVIRATVDGATDDDKHVIEIKCPSKRMVRTYVQHGIPNYYLMQLAHIYLTLGGKLDSLDFLILDGNDLYVYDVLEDKVFENLVSEGDWIIERELEFFDEVSRLRNLVSSGTFAALVDSVLGNLG
jgi:putative phage-type endonuclease